MPTNSFKELENENSKKFEERDQRIRENVNHSVGFFHFIGDILDLFSSKMVSMFLSVSGGKGPGLDKESQDKGGRSSDDQDHSSKPKYPNTFK